MELLASLFVGKPMNIMALAVLFLAGYLALRFTAIGMSRHPRSLLIASIAWVLYAAWECLVQMKTPEANIRVDLLVIWPVLAIFSAWALFRAFR
jgi:hypothetical protein